jgi:hypothetical protein
MIVLIDKKEMTRRFFNLSDKLESDLNFLERKETLLYYSRLKEYLNIDRIEEIERYI